MTKEGAPKKMSSRQSNRWMVHLTLIATAVVSLILEPRQQMHILLGLIFSIFVIVHILQRKKISRALTRQFRQLRTIWKSFGRMALADFLLLFLTLGMLASGFYDWWLGHPTKIRWHAIFGVFLTIHLLVHSLRRRGRLRTSRIE